MAKAGYRMASKASVAVIGGGISGLACAGRLNQLGIKNVTVYDGGSHSVGGRCSSRDVNIQGKDYRFDHAAQYFILGDTKFAPWVGTLGQKKYIKRWKGRIGHIDQLREFKAYPEDYQAFVGVKGMASVAEGLASLTTNIQRNTWVNNVAWDSHTQKWSIGVHGKDYQYSDYLVLANSGYEAQRLMLSAGEEAIKNIFEFQIKTRSKQIDDMLNYASVWSLTVAFPKSLQLPFDGAHVDDDDVVWVANNTSKFGNPLQPHSSQGSDDPMECWTILSSKQFGFDHSGYNFSGYLSRRDPNFDEEEMKQVVTHKLINGFSRICRRMPSRMQPCFTQAQLWQTAVPINVLKNGDSCILSLNHNIGVCGDWCHHPSIEGAAISGITLADRIKQHTLGQIRQSNAVRQFRNSGTSSDYSGVPLFITKRLAAKQSVAEQNKKHKRNIIPVGRILPPRPVKPWNDDMLFNAGKYEKYSKEELWPKKK